MSFEQSDFLETTLDEIPEEEWNSENEESALNECIMTENEWISCEMQFVDDNFSSDIETDTKYE